MGLFRGPPGTTRGSILPGFVLPARSHRIACDTACLDVSRRLHPNDAGSSQSCRSDPIAACRAVLLGDLALQPRGWWHCAAMSLGGWQYPIVRRDWQDLLQDYKENADRVPALAPLVSIIQSVIDHGMDDELAATTSMWDLVIAAEPLRDPPVDVIVVRSVASQSPAPVGQVRIEHQATSGLKETISRPAADAVALFWRFVLEKYGLRTT